ncbi:hypothetical protein M0E87_00795 [Corynebacterium sp. CCM 9185]|uniref:Uncharacterized protein n=1 Tax=Corynebacterium marambiense TaxID=2765364 RepID=A0ABS0VZJ5_9CORY|nr:hypothetical protein [Corynebacterium marambiense]MBI9001744.1 hypothetical protein [Corynebacterium marambiense]MCK7662208.1 hypothetical protein [Corynebacterium marambiense]
MELTVLISRGTFANGVRQTLEDFALLGLVKDIVWIDIDTFEDQHSTVTSMGVGTTPFIERETLQHALQRFHPDTISFGCINVVDEEDGTVNRRLFRRMTDPFFNAGLDEGMARTNLMITRVGGRISDELPVFEDCVNLLLAPEDSLGPNNNAVTFDVDSAAEDFMLHCAAGVTSVFGAWCGIEGNPTREFPHSRDGNFHLVRSYYRRIDAQAVQQQLKFGILNTETNPRPVSTIGGRLVYGDYAPDKEKFTKNAADEFMHHYRDQLRGPRVNPKVEGTQRITIGKAIGTFMKTFAVNFVSHPGRVISTLTEEGRRSTELKLQEKLYGMSGSRVQVGRDPRGVGTTSRGSAPMAGAVRDDELARELRGMWRTYVNMSLTMIDGKPRSIGQDPQPRLPVAVQVPSAPDEARVAHSANDVVPGPGCHFGRDLPHHLLNRINMSSVAPYDIAGAERFQKSLGDPAIGQSRNIPKIINSFHTWRDEHADSFANLVGRSILGTGTELRREHADRARRIEELRARRRTDVEHSTFASAMRWLGWVTILSLIGFLLAWWGGNQLFGGDDTRLEPLWIAALNSASGSTLARYFGAWFVVWLVFFALQIAALTGEEIRLLNRRDQYLSDLSAAEKNLEACELALRRCEVAYNQFLAVSDIVGSVVQYPFGTVRAAAVDTVYPATQLPDSVLLAEARPDENVIQDVAQRYRVGIYQTGWLDECFQKAEQRVVAEIDESEGRIDNDVNTDALLSQLGRGSGSLLDVVSRRMSDPSFFGVDRSQDRWERISTDLQTDSRRQQLLRPLATTDGKILGEDRLVEFPAVKDSGRFNGTFITHQGRVANFHGVMSGTIVSGTSPMDCLGSSQVLVQLSGSGNRSFLVLQSADGQEDPGVELTAMDFDPDVFSADSDGSAPGGGFGQGAFLTDDQRKPGIHTSGDEFSFLDSDLTKDL